ncbi:MAG: leucine-rich repeat domain-containing protein [bacterium]|nr:leucine-rich repeat domain-containing protein [bacterium]
MKKKILLTLAMVATFTMAACGNKAIEPTTTTDNTTTTNDVVVVDEHDRGQLDNSIPNIELPDVLFNNNGNNNEKPDDVEQTLDVSDESISLGNGDYVETNAGSGQSEMIGNERFLTATVNIGYDFEGWWLGDKLLSLQLQYKCNEGENGVEAKFSIKEAFKPFEFTSDDVNCTITGLKEDYPKELVIPEGVTSIADKAFYKSNIVVLTLPSSLKEIGDEAFKNTLLNSLTINNIDLTLGENIAEESNLYEVFVPDKTANLDSLCSAFGVDPDRLWLRNIEEGPSDLIVVGDYSFYYDTDYEEWFLDKYVGDEKDVVLPSATTEIPSYCVGYYAFSNSDTDTGLPIESITFSDAVTGIDYGAFYNCDDLKEVVISDSVTYIGSYAFYGCDSLEKVTIGNSVEEICSDAFGYTNIKNIIIPDSVTDIYEDSFEYCENLLQVTLGKKVDNINDDAFYGCYNMKTLYNYSELDIEKGSSDYGYVGYYVANIITSENEQELDEDKKDFIWHIDENTVIIDAYLGNSKDVVIPTFEYKDDEGKHYYDIVLGSNLFNDNKILETITLNEYITEIGYHTFYSCSNLKSINTLNVDEIGEEAFSYCKNLEIATLTNVTEIGYKAFYDCEKLTTVVSPKLEEIGSHAFYICYKLESIDTTNVLTISPSTFYQCYNLKNIDLTNVTSVGSYAFIECRSLENAIMSNVTSIGSYAFSKCYALRNVTFPKVTSIEGYAFEKCYSIIQITIPSTMTSSGLEENAFIYCLNLAEVINESTAFTIGATQVGPNYSYITNYSRHVINPSDENKTSIITYDTVNNMIYYEDPWSYNNRGKVFAGVIDRTAKKVVIPSGFDTIMRGSLCGCNMEELEINTDSFNKHLGYYYGLEESYNYYGFEGDYSSNDQRVPKSLKVIRLGSEMTALPKNAFYRCNSIEDIYFNSGLEIGEDAFKEISIKNVYVALSDWCNMDFANDDATPINKSNKNVNIYFKNGEDYEELDVIEIPETIAGINNKLFNYMKMTKVILHSDITIIGEYAFCGCTNLKEINIPDSVTYIGSYAFSMTKIKSIVIPENVTEIKDGTFENCTNLISVTINGNVTLIGNYAFSNCKLLYNINIPTSLASLGVYAFYNCENLTAILLKETSVTTFGEQLFGGCINLEEITFPAGLTAIDTTTFDKCDKLTFTTFDNGCYFGTEANPYKWLIKARAAQIFECVVHPDCEKIYAGAFKRCVNLRKIVIPATCTDYDGCLYGLTNLQHIEFPYTSTNAFGPAILGVSNSNVTNKLKTIVINGGTTIPASAFAGLSQLTKITLNADITTIGENAFLDCYNADIVLPETIMTIGNNAFENSGIKEYTVNTTDTSFSLGNYAFKNCIKLTSVNLYNLNRGYGAYYNYSVGTFYGCTALTTVTLPNNGKCINSYMFYGCTSLESITMQSTIDQINPYAFMNSGLKSITWPSTGGVYIKVYKGAFSNTKITTLNIPSHVLIQNGNDSSNTQNPTVGAFEGCLNLTTVIINYNMLYNSTYGGKYAFRGCRNLETVTYSASDSKIDEYTFANCTKIKSFDFSKITEIRNYAFMNTALESITLASGIVLKENAFLNSTNLEEVTFNGSMSFTPASTISSQVYGVFAGCTSLTTVNLTASVAIPNFMFMNCESLTTVNFANVKSIGDYAFKNTGFISVTLPSTITSVGREAFCECKNLTEVDLECTVDSYKIFGDCVSLTDVTIGEEVTSLASGLFYGCKSLAEIEIPESVISIKSNALEDCGFVELVIPSSVTSIGNLSLAYNKKLEKVTFNCAFTGDGYILYNCPVLKEVVFNGNITSVPGYIFQDDTKLTTVTLPDTVTIIYGYAFDGCSSLKSINIPSSLTTIGPSAFKNCLLLKSIILPEVLESIETEAFSGCYGLIEVYNLSTTLTVTIGSDENGCVAKYAKAVHTSLTEPSAIITDENGYVFLYDGEKGYLIGYVGTSRCLDLPTSFTYNETTISEYEIASYAFYQNKDIYSIKIPASVTAIGEKAFTDCYHLVEIYNLSNLDIKASRPSLNYGKSNGDLGYFAYIVHTSYEDESVVVFEGDYGFMYVDGIGYIVGYLGNSTELVLPTSFTYNENTITDLYVHAYGFANSNITSLIVPDGIVKFGQYAFAYNHSLKHVEVSNTVVNNDYHPFYDDYNVEYYKGSAYMAYYIGNPYQRSSTSYSYNDSLTTVIITSGRSISSYAFCNNSSLKTIVIPVSVTSIGTSSGNVFYNVPLEKIFYEGTSEQFFNISGLWVNGNDTAISNATKYFYSEEAPTDTENNYWHYVDGVITIWE